MAVAPRFEIGMWQDGFPVLSLGKARLILFFPLGTVTHTVFSCPELGVDPWTGWTSVVLLRGDKGRGTVSFLWEWGAVLCLLSTRDYICLFLPAHCSDVKKKRVRIKKNYHDFPFWFAELSVYTSMLTFLPFVIFMLTYSLAGTLSGFICVANKVFAGSIQTLNSCCGGHWHQSLLPNFSAKSNI